MNVQTELCIVSEVSPTFRFNLNAAVDGVQSLGYQQVREETQTLGIALDED
jgi:hypothetical protein